MKRQDIINIAGVGSIQTLINAANMDKDPVTMKHVVKVDGMFGPKTLAALNHFVQFELAPTFVTTAEDLQLPPLPETGYWENGVEVFQKWYEVVFWKFMKWNHNLTSLRRPQKDGKWGDYTYRCLRSLIDRRTFE